MTFGNEHPGNWQQYIKRKDNIGLPIMEVKRKYMIEESQFMSFMASTATANSSVGTGIGTGSPSRHRDWGKNGDKYLKKGAYKAASRVASFADNIYQKGTNTGKGGTIVSEIVYALVGGDDPENVGINGKPYYQSVTIDNDTGTSYSNTTYYIRWDGTDHWECFTTFNSIGVWSSNTDVTGNQPYPSNWTAATSPGLIDVDGTYQVRSTSWIN